MGLANEQMRKRFPHGAVGWGWGPETFYPASECCPELRQPELQRKPEARVTDKPILITRPKGMSDDDWTKHHCRELSRLRQERNRRGGTYSLNRGKVEAGRVAIQRG